MRIQKIIAFVILSLVFGCQNPIEMDFSNTEWVSDSLSIKDETQWREFVFFDSVGNFTRATLWNENYILDKGKLKAPTQIETSKYKYSIEIIDSFNIKISKNNYVGYFHGNPWEQDEYFLESLNRFIVADSVKKLLIGKWQYEKTELQLNKYYKPFEKSEEFDFGELRRVAQRSLEPGMQLLFNKDNTLIAENISQGEIKFRYKAGSENINITRQDYIILIGYKLIDNENMVLNKRSGPFGESKVYFKKVANKN